LAKYRLAGPAAAERGLFSLHVRDVRVHGRIAVKHPVHIVFFRVVDDGAIVIVRILHERMDTARHLSSGADD
jgi:plasmid stabilization system protein ParE